MHADSATKVSPPIRTGTFFAVHATFSMLAVSAATDVCGTYDAAEDTERGTSNEKPATTEDIRQGTDDEQADSETDGVHQGNPDYAGTWSNVCIDLVEHGCNHGKASRGGHEVEANLAMLISIAIILELCMSSTYCHHRAQEGGRGVITLRQIIDICCEAMCASIRVVEVTVVAFGHMGLLGGRLSKA